MKRIRYDRQEHRPESQRPQPLTTEGMKLPEGGSDEVEAWEAWLGMCWGGGLARSTERSAADAKRRRSGAKRCESSRPARERAA